MFSSTSLLALLGAGLAVAAPIFPRDVTLDPAATAEAQQRDDTATRAFTAAPIKTATGQCLTIDPNSGDFRENLIPITTAACDGSSAQQWDIITSGKHNNVAGAALVVSTLTNGCLNFDPRRAAGNQVLLFSCGGRADGGGAVTNSQLFNFAGGAGPLALVPQNGNNAVCLTIDGTNLDQTACNPAAPSGDELFTIGSGSGAAAPPTASATSSVVGGDNAESAATTSAAAASTNAAAASTNAAAASTSAAAASTTTAAASTTTAASTSAAAAAAPTGTTVLDAAAVAESQQRDNTATRAFSDAQIKTSSGQCLSVDANSGDFRENLIPITAADCDGSAGQKWDVITAGEHNNIPGNALFVSTLTQGCLNFDPRRAAGNQVLLFSCGGRADGGGSVTDSQLFTFTGGAAPLALTPLNGNNAVCLTVNGDNNLDQEACTASSPSANELFTIAS
ncbi:hypothetical protein FA95DRAFT_441227 [Auriscalpium vulgare]|uniref:Uncharacterized protein n=1 Tax=Auriscalpium vulgare TaxID=40419 RepID=A0ACB8RGV7_9AGAM|nr:hypothetical protein FA95DRAFT_441227 [Auriscalpium vulgare]